MPYFPFFVNIENSRCLVVGAGKVALRKIEKLTPFKPRITVVAPEVLPEIRAIAGIEIREREFCESDLDGAAFVIAAAGDERLNEHISVLCRERGLLCNAVDSPENCSFYFPALVQRGEVSIGISTAGNCPTLAAEIRRRLEEKITERTAEICALMGELREFVKANFPTERQRRDVMSAALEVCMSRDGDLPSLAELEKFCEAKRTKDDI